MRLYGASTGCDLICKTGNLGSIPTTPHCAFLWKVNFPIEFGQWRSPTRAEVQRCAAALAAAKQKAAAAREAASQKAW